MATETIHKMIQQNWNSAPGISASICGPILPLVEARGRALQAHEDLRAHLEVLARMRPHLIIDDGIVRGTREDPERWDIYLALAFAGVRRSTGEIFRDNRSYGELEREAKRWATKLYSLMDAQPEALEKALAKFDS